MGANLQVMDRDTKRLRRDKPFTFTNLKVDEGLGEIISWIQRELLFEVSDALRVDG